jgi:hypothetical protein
MMTLYLLCKHNEKCGVKKYDVVLSKIKDFFFLQIQEKFI